MENNLAVALFIMNIAGMFLAAGAVYGAIRADIKHIHEKIAALSLASKERLDAVERYLHQRIDDMKGD